MRGGLCSFSEVEGGELIMMLREARETFCGIKKKKKEKLYKNRCLYVLKISFVDNRNHSDFSVP